MLLFLHSSSVLLILFIVSIHSFFLIYSSSRIWQAFGFCTYEFGISALRCKTILSKIDFADPISSLKSIISIQKIASKKALFEVLKILKKEAKLLKLQNKEKKIEEEKRKYENGELEITFSVDGVNHENGFEKMEKNDCNGSGENNGNGIDGVNEGKQNGEKEGEEGGREGERKIESINNGEKGEREGEKEKGEKRDENEGEDDDDEEEEEEEEIEETPIQYSSPNPVFMEIKAGTKEQSILESLDQVTFFFVNFIYILTFTVILFYVYVSLFLFSFLFLFLFIFKVFHFELFHFW